MSIIVLKLFAVLDFVNFGVRSSGLLSVGGCSTVRCLFAVLAISFSESSFSSVLTLWDRTDIAGKDSYPTYQAACTGYQPTIYSYQQRQYKQGSSNQWQCLLYDSWGIQYPPYLMHLGYVTSQSVTCEYGHVGAACNTSLPVCDVGVFDPVSNKCVSASENGEPSHVQACSDAPNKTTGNPINFVTGNKFHKEDYTDPTSISSIGFQRYYNSSDAIWRHSYTDKLNFQSNQITLTLADGKKLYFFGDGTPKNSSASGYGELVAVVNGWAFTAKSQDVYEFDLEGRLRVLKPHGGNVKNISYGTINSYPKIFVSDEFGNQISFIQDHAGKLFNWVGPNFTIDFSYNPSNQLTRVTKTINGQQFIRQYHYEDPYSKLNLTGITDERGIRYVTWAYDTKGRAISSEHAGGVDKVQISYESDSVTIVTNELGKKTTYGFSVIDGVKHITSISGEPSANCANSNSTFTYDERGLLKTKVDNKSNLITYDYNERGLEISRTEASGTPQARIITTDWHPTLFLPVKVTEPSRITTYTYDAQGRQLSQSVTQR